MRSSFIRAGLLGAALAGAVVLSTAGLSSASFHATSRTTASVTAADDWTPPTVSLLSPGPQVSDTVTLTALASDARSGVASVQIEARPSGGAWQQVCSDPTSPYTCDWNTAGLAGGTYELRATAADVAGYTATSNTVTTAVVGDDTSTPFKALDIQAVNGGSPGRIDAGDRLVYTFSRRVDPTSITNGWDGSALAVRLQVGYVGLFDNSLDVTRGVGEVNLGTVHTTQNYLALLRNQASFEATMTASTQVVGGYSRTVVTVAVGNMISGGVGTVLLWSDLSWKPLSSIRAIDGRSLAASGVDESGPRDVDF